MEVDKSSGDDAASKRTKLFNEDDVSEKIAQQVALTREMFLSSYGERIPIDKSSSTLKMTVRISREYASIKDVAPTSAQAAPRAAAAPQKPVEPLSTAAAGGKAEAGVTIEDSTDESTTVLGGIIDEAKTAQPSSSSSAAAAAASGSSALVAYTPTRSSALIAQVRAASRVPPPVWHAPWKLMRVISGHTGWVRCLAVDSSNEWFATGGNDRTIKIWDLASGQLKITLTGHVNDVMSLAVSERSPYLFSGSTDREVKCWDLEQNKVVRQYHGHLSGVYSVALHPTLDLLVSGGRDSVARVWDIRTKAQIRVLDGHKSTVGSIICQSVEPQIITGSHDSTIRLWDLVAGKASAVLTNHKKSVRALIAHPTEYTFASGSADNIKIWKCPEGRFLRNVSGHDAILNALAVNRDNVLVSAADNGSMKFWDWSSAYCFQDLTTTVQPGSMDSEAGVNDMCFDRTGSRLLTAEVDKTIKVYKEDDQATPETHPIDMNQLKKRKRY